MDSPEKNEAVAIPSSTTAPTTVIASSAPNPRILYSSSSSNELDDEGRENEENSATSASSASGRSSPFSSASGSSLGSQSSLSPTAVYATMLSTNNIVSNSVSSTTRLPNQPTLLQHKSLSFLIMDAPSQSNLRLYLQEMQKANVKHVVRVCEPTYSKEIVEAAGIEVHDWVFPDGESPPAEVIERWLSLVDSMAAANERLEEAANHAVAVHCVAGLGRAPVLVAIALIEYGMSALDAVSFVRQKRRGAINNKQLKFLEKYQSRRERRLDKCIIQ